MAVIKIVPRSSGIAATFTALVTLVFIVGAGVSIFWVVVAMAANITTVTMLVAQLVNSKAVFDEGVLRLKYGFIRRKMPYGEIQKAVITKRGVLLWHSTRRPWDIWLKNENRDAFLAELYKHNPALAD
jgi:hypothetical protein